MWQWVKHIARLHAVDFGGKLLLQEFEIPTLQRYIYSRFGIQFSHICFQQQLFTEAGLT